MRARRAFYYFPQATGWARPVARQREDDAAGGAAGQAGAHKPLHQQPAYSPPLVLRQHRHVHHRGCKGAI